MLRVREYERSAPPTGACSRSFGACQELRRSSMTLAVNNSSQRSQTRENRRRQTYLDYRFLRTWTSLPLSYAFPMHSKSYPASPHSSIVVTFSGISESNNDATARRSVPAIRRASFLFRAANTRSAVRRSPSFSIVDSRLSPAPYGAVRHGLSSAGQWRDGA